MAGGGQQSFRTCYANPIKERTGAVCGKHTFNTLLMYFWYQLLFSSLQVSLLRVLTAHCEAWLLKMD